MNGLQNVTGPTDFETVPSNHLEPALWLEADRRGFPSLIRLPRKCEVQRATLKMKWTDYENYQPYGLAFGEILSQSLISSGHPYSCPTLVTRTYLDRSTVADLKMFSFLWYVPNHAVLSVSGRNSQKMYWPRGKYFGSMPQSPEVRSPCSCTHSWLK